jgi:hypothetical protein
MKLETIHMLLLLMMMMMMMMILHLKQVRAVDDPYSLRFKNYLLPLAMAI